MKTPAELMEMVKEYGDARSDAERYYGDLGLQAEIDRTRLETEIRTALAAHMGWRGIADAPRDRRILVWTGMNQYVAKWAQNPMTGHVGWLIGDNGNGEQLIVVATHWKDLPLPPAEGEK